MDETKPVVTENISFNSGLTRFLLDIVGFLKCREAVREIQKENYPN